MPPNTNTITESVEPMIRPSSCSSAVSNSTCDHSTKSELESACKKNGIKIIEASNGITYYHCTSRDPFDLSNLSKHRNQDDSRNKNKTAEEVNQMLNLNLGLTSIDPNDPTLRKTLRNIVNACWWIEKLLIALWINIPLMVRHWLVLRAWKVYFSLHRIILGRSTGIHPDASLEYHALTSICWWTRLFPATVERMRFALNQLQVYHPPSRNIKTRAIAIAADTTTNNTTTITAEVDSSDPVRVNDCDSCLINLLDTYGVYVSLRCAEANTDNNDDPSKRKVVFWIFGGAFLAGDVEGNMGCAENIATQCGASAVFLANYRLAPEYNLQDAYDDVYHSYHKLLSTYSVTPKNIIVYGISSGGGIALNLMQRLVAEKKTELLPAGAVLMCPFVDYTEPKGSMLHYSRHDLIVNQSVVETGFPFFESKIGSMEERRKASPVYGNFEQLPPLLVVVSEHECCFDQCILLANRAREAKVDCTLGIWVYMCHVFPILSPFIPEGKQAQEFMCEWMKSRFNDEVM